MGHKPVAGWANRREKRVRLGIQSRRHTTIKADTSFLDAWLPPADATATLHLKQIYTKGR